MIYKTIALSIMLILNMLSLSSASELSLYQSTANWKDEKNNTFSLGGMKGKKVVMAMAYTSCQGTCPMIVSKLKKIEKLFNEKNIKVDVIVITFDPGFDTPERNYSFYREKMSITKDNWHFLNGSDNETRKMSMLLGIKYAVNPTSRAIIHDNKIILINETGEIERKLESLDDSEAGLIN
jgi:protein SCO1/2